MVRKSFFRFIDFLEVDLQRAVGDQLDIIEAGYALPVEMHSRKPGRGIDNRIAQRFPHSASPACLKGPLHLIAGIGRRRRGQPEWIG
ncbi:hypothetical protein D3C87_1593650 [compost metagenome]